MQSNIIIWTQRDVKNIVIQSYCLDIKNIWNRSIIYKSVELLILLYLLDHVYNKYGKFRVEMLSRKLSKTTQTCGTEKKIKSSKSNGIEFFPRRYCIFRNCGGGDTPEKVIPSFSLFGSRLDDSCRRARWR